MGLNLLGVSVLAILNGHISFRPVLGKIKLFVVRPDRSPGVILVDGCGRLAYI